MSGTTTEAKAQAIATLIRSAKPGTASKVADAIAVLAGGDDAAAELAADSAYSALPGLRARHRKEIQDAMASHKAPSAAFHEKFPNANRLAR